MRLRSLQAPTLSANSSWAILGGLRLILACAVLGTHIPFVQTQPNRLVNAFNTLGGLSAVLGFLIISGYSISNSISHRRSGFLYRRLLRVYPLYVLACVVSLIPFVHRTHLVTQLLTYAAPSMSDLIGNLTFVSGLLGHQLTSDPVVWTLSIEVALYLSAPLLDCLHSGWILGLAAASAAAYSIFPHLVLPHYTALPWGMSLGFLAWAWLAGFIYFRHRTQLWAKAALMIGVITLSLLNDDFGAPHSHATVIGSALVICCCEFVSLPQWIETFLYWCGDISYPLYLLHFPVLLALWRFAGPVPVNVEIACAIAAATIAVGMDMAFRKLLARAQPQITPSLMPTPG